MARQGISVNFTQSDLVRKYDPYLVSYLPTWQNLVGMVRTYIYKSVPPYLMPNVPYSCTRFLFLCVLSRKYDPYLNHTNWPGFLVFGGGALCS